MISVSLSRRLVLAEEEMARKRVSDILEEQKVLMNRREKQFTTSLDVSASSIQIPAYPTNTEGKDYET